jgi:hypothetical protein
MDSQGRRKQTMNYLMLFCGKLHDLEVWEALSDEARAQYLARLSTRLLNTAPRSEAGMATSSERK